MGYLFLEDKRNSWLDKGKDWVLRWVLGLEKFRSEWFSDRVDEANLYKHIAVRRYGRSVE